MLIADETGFNLLLVIYLARTKRLFGIGGGKKACEARLRAESVIEIEQAALAATSPGQPGHRQPASVAAQRLVRHPAPPRFRRHDPAPPDPASPQ